nr:deoxynucleoside kinase [Eremococcus coleocola]
MYEDWYFCKVNRDIGNISETEFKIYEKLLDNMMEELAELPQKAPDLMVYLHGSFEKIMERIASRGRDFEQDPALVDYYHKLWSGYDEWIDQSYHASQVLKINIDQFDVVHNPEDAAQVIAMVQAKLGELD